MPTLTSADAVATEQGRAATLGVPPPVVPEQAGPFPPPGCWIPRQERGGEWESVFVRFHVDDGILVEIEWFPSGERRKHAPELWASDNFCLREGWKRRPPSTGRRPNVKSTWKFTSRAPELVFH